MTDNSVTPGKPLFFSLFNRDALLKSTPSESTLTKMPLDPSSRTISEDLIFTQPTVPHENLPKNRGQKKKGKNNKDRGDPSITIKEIIENDKTGIPTQNEKKVQEERIRILRESRGRKKKEQAPDNENSVLSQPQPKDREKSSKVEEETDDFVPATIAIKDGKVVVLEQNLSMLPKISDKVHNLAATKPKKLNSMSFRQKANSKKWTEEENRKFYKLLKIFGPDFSMIAKVFENRSRDEIKNKFLREERQNPGKIDASFTRNKKYEINNMIDTFSKPKQITNSERQEEKSTELVPQRQSSNHEDDEFNKKPGLSNNISSSSLDSMDYRIFGNIKKLLNDDLTLSSRTPSQILQGGPLKAPGLEKGLSARSNDLDTIPTIDRNLSSASKEKQQQQEDNYKLSLPQSESASAYDRAIGETAASQSNKDNNTFNTQSNEPTPPKNLFFHS